MWLHSKNTLFTMAGSGLDLAHTFSLLTPTLNSLVSQCTGWPLPFCPQGIHLLSLTTPPLSPSWVFFSCSQINCLRKCHLERRSRCISKWDHHFYLKPLLSGWRPSLNEACKALCYLISPHLPIFFSNPSLPANIPSYLLFPCLPGAPSYSWAWQYDFLLQEFSFLFFPKWVVFILSIPPN